MRPLCEAALPDSDGWLYICDRVATGLYRYGCVHEHVGERWTCDVHHPVDGDVGCRACLEAGHECLMAFQLVPA